MAILHRDCCCQMYQYQIQAVVATLYDMTSDMISLGKPSNSQYLTCKNNKHNCFKWLGSSKGHRFQNIALVQSDNSPTGDDKKDLHIPRLYIHDSMQNQLTLEYSASQISTSGEF